MARAPHVVLLNASLDESDMYRWWLESSGYCVSVVGDVPAVCDVAAADRVDVLVIDAMFAHEDRNVRLPELLAVLSRRRGFRIITLSGYLPGLRPAQPYDGEICLPKPCLPPHLCERIEQLLTDAPPAPPGP